MHFAASVAIARTDYMLPQPPVPHCGLPQPIGIIGKLLAEDPAPPATCPAGTLSSFSIRVPPHVGHVGCSWALRISNSTWASHFAQ